MALILILRNALAKQCKLRSRAETKGKYPRGQKSGGEVKTVPRDARTMDFGQTPAPGKFPVGQRTFPYYSGFPLS